MKSIWSLLEIEPTSDTKVIRQAYANRLFQKNPEVDPEGFQELRTAYEMALSQASSKKPSAQQDPVHEEKKREPSIGAIPKAVEIAEKSQQQPGISGIIRSAEPAALKPAPDISEETLQAQQMMEKLLHCQNAELKLRLIKQWKEEGSFNSFRTSVFFQEELLDHLSFRTNFKSNLFLACYQIFSWDQLLQGSHPLGQKIGRMVEKYLLGDALAFLKKTAGFPLLQAAVMNDIESGRQLLKKHSHEKDQEGNGELHIACEVGSLEFAAFLIDQHANVEEENLSGQTALMIAVEKDNLPLCELLCKAGADINPQRGRKRSPLVIAVLRSNEEMVKFLGAQPNFKMDPNALTAAVLTHQLDFVKLLIKMGCPVSPEGVVEAPLIGAARSNHLTILKVLLDKGADPHQMDSKGKTALTIAAERGFSQIVTQLLPYCANDHSTLNATLGAIQSGHFNVVNLLMGSFDLTDTKKIINFRGIQSSMYCYGFTSCMDDLFMNIEAIDFNNTLAVDSLPPLIKAVYRDNLPQLKELLQGGMDTQQTLQNGLAALHVAILLNRRECFDCLLQHQANIHQVSPPYYFSPLFVAMKAQNKYAYRKLIELGAQDLPTVFSHSALFAAVYHNDIPAVQELIARRSDIYQYAGDGFRTLVYAAARYQHHEMLKILLSYGLHPDRIGGDPYTMQCVNYKTLQDVAITPLAVAVKNHDREMITLLLEAGADPNRKSIGIPPLHLAMPRAFPPGETINYYAGIENCHSVINLLLEKGADINLPSDDGQTFLSKAVRADRVETVIHLIECGADVRLRDHQGKRPVDHAREAKNELLVRYLLQCL